MDENRPVPKDVLLQNDSNKRNLHCEGESSFSNDSCTASTEGNHTRLEQVRRLWERFQEHETDREYVLCLKMLRGDIHQWGNTNEDIHQLEVYCM